ncbi:hypothetical protein PHLGIDRAFT_120730 [Phlebiopsis gigantea 11061_1 CR5-6]|uniref:Phytanoyl-CoA dioxygenase n=1 Tax=Phlebiopsis gigantea (strain 11061_1 CR5-6) TaxID=745531 RepID=A0A0C3PFN4_PHLG1|nr:hypothetical protein PHLGIDRAFT_120730 [Phlebiopsis gigantea 11061_1 CR5-6]
MVSASAYKETYDKQGYVIIPGLIPDDTLPELTAAAERAVERTRLGSWQHRRTLGRQFPPFDESDPDSWGVQHIMHPDLGEPAFVKWYTSDMFVKAVLGLLCCKEDELQMELFNMLINPTSHDFALRWHRDDVKETAGEEEERDALSKWHFGIQWNAALFDDSCLYLVPGSHALPRTPEQRSQSSTMDPPTDPMDMPGAIQVTIKRGETAFYNSNILHCAAYSSRSERATLHGTMGCTRGGSSRARNILQHGLDWMTDPRFRDALDARGKMMLDNVLRMKAAAGKVEYSLEN